MQVVEGVLTPTGRRRTITAESEKHARYLIGRFLNPPAFWAIKNVEVRDLEDWPSNAPLPSYFFEERRSKRYKEVIRHCERFRKHTAHAYSLPAGGGMRACDGTAFQPDWLNPAI
jgi:hypothetical protein